MASSRSVRGLVLDLRDDRQAVSARFADKFPAAAETGHRVPARSADAVGHRLPDCGGAGRAGGSRAAGRVSSDPV